MQENQPPTQHIMLCATSSIANFPYFFKDNLMRTWFLWCCILRGVGKKNPAPLSYCLSRRLAEGIKNIPPLLNCSRQNKHLFITGR